MPTNGKHILNIIVVVGKLKVKFKVKLVCRLVA